VHIITRRRFETDLRRHFAGVVETCTESIIRVKGYAFIFDPVLGEFVRREKMRARLFGLMDAGLIINILPDTVDLENLTYTTDSSGNRILTDNKDFKMNISEFGAFR
jgi:hypothetical protein